MKVQRQIYIKWSHSYECIQDMSVMHEVFKRCHSALDSRILKMYTHCLNYGHLYVLEILNKALSISVKNAFKNQTYKQ